MVDTGTTTKKLEETKVNGVTVTGTVETTTKVHAETGLSTLLTEKSWKSMLRAEFNKPYFKDIEKHLQTAWDGGKTVYPPKSLIFNAFNLTPLHELKLVIIGQDPYHGPGQVRLELGSTLGMGILDLLCYQPATSLVFIFLMLFQAHGLCFSVPMAIDPPPSLKNIFTELTSDIPGFRRPNHGCLEAWAKRGVLLLNATLTVE